MIKFYLIISVLVLYNFKNICCKKKCKSTEDCMTIPSCPEAQWLAEYRQTNKTINAKLISSHCGIKFVDKRPAPMVCCSDFEVTNRTLDMRIANSTEAYPRAKDDILDLTRHHNIELLPNVCGAHVEDRVIGGQKADLYEFPWMALISYTWRNNDGSISTDFHCGGSIINSRYILTAGHCVTNKQIKGVRLGEYDISTSTDCGSELVCESHLQDVEVEDITVHEDFNMKAEVANDIALIRVKDEINFSFRNVAPICLPIYKERSKLNRKIATVAGWGTTETGLSSKILLKVAVEIHPDVNCDENGQKLIICAGGSGHDSCAGDSGGPLMYIDEYNTSLRMIQYGIVSRGKDCALIKNPGIYTDVRKYLRWILDKIHE